MSSIILSSILTEFIGPLGQIVGSELQTILGEELSDAIFGLDAEKKVIHESKLQDLQVQTSAYGKVIPIIYGTVRIGGNIIWAQPLKEKYINKIDKITYSYYATLAIALCKGEIKKLNRIWANEKPLSFDAIDCTFYKGTEDQNPDSFISSIENKGYDKDNVPAYRGISYIVIKDFPVIEYNNRIPIFTFEVQSTLKSEEFSVNDNVENVNMIPGSGEFVYDTKIQKKISQQKINNSQYIQYGFCKSNKSQ